MSSSEVLTPVLEGADADLVRRDPALPMLPLLLDDAVLSAWLSAHLGEPVVARRLYLRYKVGTACVAAVRLRPASTGLDLPGQGNEPRPDDRTVMVALWAQGARSKLTKTRDKAAPGSLLLVDDALGVVVSTPAADRDLPAMGRLEHSRRRRRVVSRLAGSAFAAGTFDHDLRCRTLSYKPQRRWVAAASAAGGDRMLLRAYRPADLAGRVAASTALAGEDLVPRLLGTDEDLGLAAYAWVEGRQLHLPDDGAHLPALGERLGRLHARTTSLPRLGPGVRVRGLHDTAALAATLLPELGPRLEILTARAGRALLAQEQHHDQRGPATLHGDLSADQVVVTPEGDTRLIDLDRARTGHPADDLGSLVATARVDGVPFPGLLEQVLSGYVDHLPAPTTAAVETYAAVQLLERATDGFRLARRDWAARLEDALTGAEELLTSVERGGAA